MSDQATPMMRMAIFTTFLILVFMSNFTNWIDGTLSTWDIIWGAIILFLAWLIPLFVFPDYWWWPNNAEERVKRLEEWEAPLQKRGDESR